MKYYQPIYKDKEGWHNLIDDYFENFKEAKQFIEKRNPVCDLIGLDVFNRDKNEYLGMFWQYDNGQWIRNYKD